MRRLGVVVLGLLLSQLPQFSRAESEAAVLILAQSGNKSWKSTVKRAVKDAQIPYPARIYFGSGDTVRARDEFQEVIQSLEGSGADIIYVVPLTVSSYMETVRQWKYLLGEDVQPGFRSTPLFPIRRHAAIRFLEPLNDSAVVVEILLDRAHEISSKPEEETVILVSRGAKDHADNDRWLQILKSLSFRLRERGGYKAVEAVTLRDDSTPDVRQRAVDYLRQRVRATEKAGERAIVITLLLSPGGIEHRIGLELRGLTYAFNTKTLLPDSRISEWIRSQIP